MILDGKTRLLGVLGNPVSHTLSPVMQNALLQHLGINAVYLPFPCETAKLGDAIQGLRALGFVGANVTIPFKEALLQYVDALSPMSQFMGSVNTLYWENGKLMGTTTDAYGALNNLADFGHSVQGQHVALLGNGGASRALAFAILQQRPASLCILGRDASKLEKLCKELSNANLPLNADYGTLDSFASMSKRFTMLINGTSVGMAPQADAIPVDPTGLHAGMVVYDIVYSPAETLLLREAKQRDCPTVPGIGMLIHQGALSFEHWFPGAIKDRGQAIQIMRNAIEAFRKS